MHASMERRVFEQTQANDEDLRSQLASVIKEERERKVGMCDALCVCVSFWRWTRRWRQGFSLAS